MTEFEQAFAAVADVDGWLSVDQARRLYDASARTISGQRIVEIGSFRGRSTVMLALAAPAGVEIVAIDPHAGNDRGPQEIEGFQAEAADDHEVFMANLRRAGVADRVRHVRSFSADAHIAIEGSIDVLYIDGAHRYHPARTDIRDWGARVTPSGTLLVHDTFSSLGVTLAAVRELFLGRRFRYVGRSRSLAEYRADLVDTNRARLFNAGRQMVELPWFAKNLMLKIFLTLKLGRLLRRVSGRDPEWPY